MGSKLVVIAASSDPDDPAHLISSGAIQIVDSRTLAEAQGEVLSRLGAAMEARIAAGRNYRGAAYQIDDASRANITAAGALALASLSGAAPWPEGFYWIAADNSHVAMSDAECFAFAQDVAGYYTALVYANRALKDAIAALATNDACDAFEIGAGWPANS
jgi:hypothetical protein